MSGHALHHALDRRDPQALADALAQHRNTETQAETLLDVLYDCTVGEVKRVHAWAEDWLSAAGNNALRVNGDTRWQAMNTVYKLAADAINASGVNMRNEQKT
jgi:hypothetical protein